MKFSKGMWHAAPDTIIRWATESVKAEATTDSLRVVAASRPINHRGDTLNNPTLTIEVSSPSEGVISLNSYHWKAQKSTSIGPHYELYPDGVAERNDNLKTKKTETSLVLSTDTLKATIDTRPKSFAVDFHTGSKLLTKLGWRSIGYIEKDSDGHPNTELMNPGKGERWFTCQLQLGVGEKIYGLGERFGPFVKNGQTVDMWNEDGGTSSELTYKNVPFYMSSAGYGIFIPSPAFISYEIQSERTTRVNISIPGESLPMFLIYGPTPKTILERYTTLTGRPSLVPSWTFGLWLSTSFTTNYSEATVDEFLNGMQFRKIPTAVFHYDCFWMKGFQWCDFEFDPEFFPDARGQLKRLKERGVKICVWINPYIAQESRLFDEGVEGGYFIKRKDGSVWQYDAWQAGMAFVDFTNPKACEWYQSKLENLVDMGVDVFKTDFGERIPTGNTVYFDGSSPEKMHNFYPFLYNKVTFALLEKKLGKNNATVFARSATAGVQRFPVHWGGDPMSTFEAMAETLRGGLSLGLCGFGYWAHDIGGFEGKPEPGLFKRWIAFGLLSSHSRLHGSGSFRAPWLIDESGEADKVLKKFVNFKLRLMPYLYRQAILAHKFGYPMMRPMFAEFPEDPITWHLDTQYMLGENILVAPIFNDEGHVQYYVPKGKWYGLLDRKFREGPGYFEEEHDFFSLPALLRPGGVVVFGNNDQVAHYDWTEGIRLLVNEVKGMDVTVDIPDYENAGEIKTELRVESGGLGLNVTVKGGSLMGDWCVVVPGRIFEESKSDEINVIAGEKEVFLAYVVV